MKRFVIGFVAIILAIGLNAFTPDNPKPAKLPISYVWFTVNTGKGATNPVVDADVTFAKSLSDTPPTADCSGTPTNRCVVGFDQSQVSGTHLNSGAQSIMTTSQRRQAL